LRAQQLRWVFSGKFCGKSFVGHDFFFERFEIYKKPLLNDKNLLLSENFSPPDTLTLIRAFHL